MRSEIHKIQHALADIWIGSCQSDRADYCYGGTRLVKANLPETEVRTVLQRLLLGESLCKNRLINLALAAGAVHGHKSRLPRGFLGSCVGGARCIIRPRGPELAAIFEDTTRPEHCSLVRQLFRCIGEFLNDTGGAIKLTPDFGRFAGLADILAEYTPHVLGIRCRNGGCGGKSSYSTTGILAALEQLHSSYNRETPFTVIGAAGALGSEVLAYLRAKELVDLAVSDIAYHGHNPIPAPARLPLLASERGRFTEACLARGGVVIATTWGQELENSPWQALPSGTLLLLAHNLAIPVGDRGVDLMKRLAAQGVLAFPGQILTLGGALTSRLEWFWRQLDSPPPFDKPLAHEVVKDVVRYWVSMSMCEVTYRPTTPYEIMLRHTQLEDGSREERPEPSSLPECCAAASPTCGTRRVLSGTEAPGR